MEKFQETKLGLIPSDWGLIKSKDFCDKVTDGTHDTPKQQSDGHFLVTSKNLTDNGIDFSTCYHISSQEYNQINQRSRVEQYDVLFGMIGTVGNSAIVTQKKVDFAIKNVGLFKLNGNYEKALWLKNYFSSKVFYNYLRKQMAGTTQQFVGLGFLRKSPIIIPKTNTDEIDWVTIKSINYVLSKVDEAIEAVRQSIKTAEKLKKALMQNLLTGKLKPDGTWRKEDEFYEDEKFGKVPVGWEVARVKDICINLDNRRKPIKAIDRQKMKGQYRYYGAAGIIDYVNDYIFDGKYILFGEDGENLISRKRPQAFIVEGKFWVNNHAHILEPIREKAEIHFICYILESKNYESIVYGSAQPKINKSDLNKIKLFVPKDTREQYNISKKLINTDNLLQQKQTKIQTLQRLKKSLMQNLLTGKVRVDIDAINKIISEQSNG